MTWSTIAASGKGKLAIFLRIAGVEWIFSTQEKEPDPTDTWYWNGAVQRYSGIKPWLRHAGIQLDEQADFVEGTLDVADVDLEVTDVDGGFTSLFAASQYRTWTRLAADVAAADVSITVEGTTGFAAAGTIWIDQEAITYTGTAAGPPRFTGCTRGALGTVAADHVIDTAALPIIVPIVTDGCTVLAGRRANIYVAEVDRDGVLSASECIYRGVVAPDIGAEQGVVKLRLDHIVRLWSRLVGQRLAGGSIRPGYSYCGGENHAVLVKETETAFPYGELQAQVVLTAGYYPGPDDLVNALHTDTLTILAAEGFSTYFTVDWHSSYEKAALHLTDIAGYAIVVTVREGDPLWAMGFDPGEYANYPGWTVTDYEAANAPRLYVGEVARRSGGFTADQTCELAGYAQIEVDFFAMIGQSAYQRVKSIADSTIGLDGDYTVTFEPSSMDRAHDNQSFIAVEDAKDLVIRQVFAFAGAVETVRTAAQKCFRLFPGQTEPQAWCVQGLESDDFDWTELDDAFVGAPLELQTFYDAVTKPVSVGELICDRLGLLGIAPRITAEGRIGFARLQTPHELLAYTVELNAAMWAIVAAAKVRTQLEGQARINQVSIEHTYDYRSDAWGPTCSIALDSVNNLGKTISKDYSCRGLLVSSDPGVQAYDDLAQLVHGVAARAIGVHFGVLGRAAPEVTIDCTWTAKQLLIGDIVKITHPCIIDAATGTVGVVERLGIVKAKTHQVTDQGLDRLVVILPPEQHVAPIAPACRATAWVAGTLTLSVPTTTYYCQAGADDLDHFEDGYELRFTEYNSEAPATFGPATIDSTGANSIVLKADPFGGAFPANGVICHWARWDEVVAVQQYWLFFGDTAYGLGAAPDEAFVWAL